MSTPRAYFFQFVSLSEFRTSFTYLPGEGHSVTIYKGRNWIGIGVDLYSPYHALCMAASDAIERGHDLPIPPEAGSQDRYLRALDRQRNGSAYE